MEKQIQLGYLGLLWRKKNANEIQIVCLTLSRLWTRRSARMGVIAIVTITHNR